MDASMEDLDELRSELIAEISSLQEKIYRLEGKVQSLEEMVGRADA